MRPTTCGGANCLRPVRARKKARNWRGGTTGRGCMRAEASHPSAIKLRKDGAPTFSGGERWATYTRRTEHYFRIDGQPVSSRDQRRNTGNPDAGRHSGNNLRGMKLLSFPKPRSVLSQVPKCKAPGAPIFSGCSHFSRHLGHPPVLPVWICPMWICGTKTLELARNQDRQWSLSSSG